MVKKLNMATEVLVLYRHSTGSVGLLQDTMLLPYYVRYYVITMHAVTWNVAFHGLVPKLTTTGQQK